jgi:N-acetyl-anhydromuramyl-L-alanine amidase AmpD
LEVLTILKKKQPDVKVRIVGHRDLSPDLDKDGVVEPHEWVKLCPCFNAEPEYKGIKV